MEENLACSKCQTSMAPEDIYSSNCGYPEQGTLEEINKYNHSIKLKMDVLKDGLKKLKSVKILLYILAGINVVFGIYSLTNELTFADGIGNLIAAGVFLGCDIWVNNQPLIIEMSYGFGTKGSSKCTGFWDKELKWHEGKFNPFGWMVENLISS